MTNIKIVPATKEYLTQFYSGKSYPTMRAYAGISDEKVHGIFGIRIQNGQAIAFSDMDEIARKNKRIIVKGCRLIRKMIDNFPMSVRATPDARYPEADKFLRHVGFVKDGDTYLWPTQ